MVVRCSRCSLACVRRRIIRLGSFIPFVGDTSVALYGAELLALGGHRPACSNLDQGRQGVFTVPRWMFYSAHGQILKPSRFPAGLDYPGIGPEHSYFHERNQAGNLCACDRPKALEAFQLLSKVEGIIPALESSHAITCAVNWPRKWGLKNP